MHEDIDRVDSALESLRAGAWLGESHSRKLEEKLMQEFHTTKKSSWGISRYRTLIAVLAVVLVGGAAFATVGGPEAVKEVFVNVRILIMGPDGESSIEIVKHEPLEVEDGVAMTTLNVAGGEAILVLERLDAAGSSTGLDGDQGEAMVTITMGSVLDPDGEAYAERTIELSTAVNLGGDPLGQEVIRELIAKAELVFPWEDHSGEPRELYIVQDADDETGSTFRIFSSRWLETGEEVYDMIGLLSGTTAGELDVAHVEVDETGLITMTVLSEDDQERTITFSTEVKNFELRAPRINVVHEHE